MNLSFTDNFITLANTCISCIHGKDYQDQDCNPVAKHLTRGSPILLPSTLRTEFQALQIPCGGKVI
jgi:hypothetical protein